MKKDWSCGFKLEQNVNSYSNITCISLLVWGSHINECTWALKDRKKGIKSEVSAKTAREKKHMSDTTKKEGHIIVVSGSFSRVKAN